MKYIRLFENDADYQAFISGGGRNTFNSLYN